MGGLVEGGKTGYHSETIKLKNKKKKRILISMVLDHELGPLRCSGSNAGKILTYFIFDDLTGFLKMELICETGPSRAM